MTFRVFEMRRLRGEAGPDSLARFLLDSETVERKEP
jgi:hypothetical protein